MAQDIACKFHEPGVLIITMKDKSTIIKTVDEMEAESPNFRGIVTQTNLLYDQNGNAINQQDVEGWRFQRGYVAQTRKDGQWIRVFGETNAEAYNGLRGQLA